MLFAATLAILEELRAEARGIDPSKAEEQPSQPIEDGEEEDIAGELPYDLRVLWIMIQRYEKLLQNIAEQILPLLHALQQNSLALTDYAEQDVLLFQRFIELAERKSILDDLFTLSVRRCFPSYSIYPFAVIRAGWIVIFAEQRQVDNDAPDEDLDGVPIEVTASAFSGECEGSDGVMLPLLRSILAPKPAP